MCARHLTARTDRVTGTPASAVQDGGSAYDFAFADIDGKPIPLSSFRGKVVLVVNTASRCGFRSQYRDLQAVWERYRDRGLVVLGVPSNDFADQEPGTDAQIKSFCEANFDVRFPMTAKVHVSGRNAHPFYRWAARELGFFAKPRWNFHKYLVGPDGRLADWFSTPVSPTSRRVTRAIEVQLSRLGATRARPTVGRAQRSDPAAGRT